MEKARSRDNYWRMHEQGKTEQAKADLARLARIREQREEAARQRQEEKKRSLLVLKSSERGSCGREAGEEVTPRGYNRLLCAVHPQPSHSVASWGRERPAGARIPPGPRGCLESAAEHTGAVAEGRGFGVLARADAVLALRALGNGPFERLERGAAVASCRLHAEITIAPRLQLAQAAAAPFHHLAWL
jgi:hypothetical protein